MFPVVTGGSGAGGGAGGGGLAVPEEKSWSVQLLASKRDVM